jgi:uncharacterized membrane protein YbhN (UPF0104 family)
MTLSKKMRLTILLLQGLGMIGLLGALLWDFDWQSLSNALSQMSLGRYIFWLALLYGGQLLLILKWKLVLQSMGQPESFTSVHQHYFIGAFFNNFFPTAFGGDVAKIYYLGQTKGYLSTGYSVIVDRCLGLLFTSVWAAGCVFLIQLEHPLLQLAKQTLIVCSLGFLVLFLAVLYLPLPLAQWIRLKVRPSSLCAFALLVLGYYSIVGWIYYDYFALTEGTAISPQALLLIVMSIGIFSNLPISINGIGVREQLHFLLLGIFQIPKETAVSIALIVFSQMLLLSALGGVFWWRVRKHLVRETGNSSSH